MALTFGEIRKLVAPYAGRAGLCPEDAEVARFSRLVMETLLYSGSNAGVRRLNILACKGCIALPPEVEVPLKARIDHQVANIWDKWFTFHSVNEDLDRNCRPAGEVMMEDGDFTPIAYPLPPNGSQIGVMGLCKESEDASVIIQGKDTTGHPIFTMWKGEQIGGEKIAISKGVIKYGQVKFGSIDAVLKSKTNGYVSLFAVCPKTNGRTLLAEYTPQDEKPLYRKFKIISRNCAPIVHVSMLCRVRLKDNYHDNDITFFDNSLAVILASQRVQSEVNMDSENANYKNQAVVDILNKESDYKKINGSPVDVYHPLSGGSIRNII